MERAINGFHAEEEKQMTPRSTEQILHDFAVSLHYSAQSNGGIEAYDKAVETAKKELRSLVYREIRLGQQEIVNLGKQRLVDDPAYSLDAFLEDCQEYLNRISKENA